MTMEEFLNKVVEIYFRDSCSPLDAIDRTKKELNITRSQFIECFGKVKNYDNNLCGPVFKN